MRLLDSLFGPNVAALKQRRDVRGLILALGYKRSPAVQTEALEVLGEAITGRIGQFCETVRRGKTGGLLERIAWNEIVQSWGAERLVAALNDKDPHIQASAEKAIAVIKRATVAAWSAALQDEAPAVRYKAVQALEDLPKDMKDHRVFEQITSALKDQDQDVRHAAHLALQHSEDPRAIQPLIDALRDETWDGRLVAASLLEELTGRNLGVDSTDAAKWEGIIDRGNYDQGREITHLLVDELRELHRAVSELPTKHAFTGVLVGAGPEQARQQFEVLCDVIGDAVRALEEKVDIHGSCISPTDIADGLQRLVSDVRQPQWMGLVLGLLDVDGGLLLERHIDQLEAIANKIA
jgi:hypothetical protein